MHVLAVRGSYDDCRRLELELGSLFPWGFVSGNLHPYASEGAKTIAFEIAEQLGVAASRRSRLPRRERHALREADARVRRADPGRARTRAVAADVRRTGPRLEPDRVRVRRRPQHLARARGHACRVARCRRSLARRPRARRRTRDRRRGPRPPRGRDRDVHRAAHGDDRCRTGCVGRRGSRRADRRAAQRHDRSGIAGRARRDRAPARPRGVEGPHVRTIDPNAADVLAALGLAS